MGSSPSAEILQMPPITAQTRPAEQLARRAVRDRGSVAFKVHDNGGRPFKVRITLDSVSVTEADSGRRILKTAYSEIWLGQGEYENPREERRLKCHLGCAVLIVSGQKLVLVSSDVRAFGLEQGERVLDFIATVCNSDVVYGFIITNKRVLYPRSINCMPDRGGTDGPSLASRKKISSGNTWEVQMLRDMQGSLSCVRRCIELFSKTEEPDEQLLQRRLV